MASRDITPRRRRTLLLAEARRRADRLASQYPPLEQVAQITDPALRRVAMAHRATLTALTATALSDATLHDLLTDAHDAHTTYTDAAESDDDGGNAAGCIADCDQNLKDCLESWGEIAGGEDIDLFDGELEPQDDEDQTDGGAVGSIDDNPLDVENEDTSDTGGDEDVEDSHDAPFGEMSWGDTIAVSGLCSISYTMCLLACELEAFGG
jgi:hypothetical protein